MGHSRNRWFTPILALTLSLALSGCALGVPAAPLFTALVALVALLFFAACGGATALDTDPIDDGDEDSCGDGRCIEYMTCDELPDGEPWCFPDADRDGLRDADDNCPYAPNEEQLDDDLDGLGDACDLCPGPSELSPCGAPCCEDPDGDGLAGIDMFSSEDLCPYISDSSNTDEDGDSIGDACDIEYEDPLSPCGIPYDSDGDGIADLYGCSVDEIDDCPYTPSAHSGDADSDNIGDVCDPDGIAPEPIARLHRDAFRRDLLERLGAEGVLDSRTVELALS
jgi:thrombospondin 2/3/4/5